MSSECVGCGATGEQAVSHQRFGCTELRGPTTATGTAQRLRAQRDAARARIAELEALLRELLDYSGCPCDRDPVYPCIACKNKLWERIDAALGTENPSSQERV